MLQVLDDPSEDNLHMGMKSLVLSSLLPKNVFENPTKQNVIKSLFRLVLAFELMTKGYVTLCARAVMCLCLY